jgi:hypothetical protein
MFRTATDLPGTQRTSIRPVCARDARLDTTGSCLACSGLTVLAISIPNFQTVLLGRFRMRRPDSCLRRQQASVPERNQEVSAAGLLSTRSDERALWRVRLSGFWLEVRNRASHCGESAPRQSGSALTDAAGRLGEDIVGYLATHSRRQKKPRDAHPDGS